MALTKCCCCIPLRPAVFIIAAWFFFSNAFEAITGFLGRNTTFEYLRQTSPIAFWVEEILTILVALGGFLGLVGVTCASRNFVYSAAAIIWFNVVVSIVKRVGAVVIIGLHQDGVIASCEQDGIFTLTNPDTISVLTNVASNSSSYTPVIRPGTLNQNNITLFNGTKFSKDFCQKEAQYFLIGMAIVVAIVELFQIYFAAVVSAYAKQIKSGARHHRLRETQIRDWDESQVRMKESSY